MCRGSKGASYAIQARSQQPSVDLVSGRAHKSCKGIVAHKAAILAAVVIVASLLVWAAHGRLHASLTGGLQSGCHAIMHGSALALMLEPFLFIRRQLRTVTGARIIGALFLHEFHARFKSTSAFSNESTSHGSIVFLCGLHLTEVHDSSWMLDNKMGTHPKPTLHQPQTKLLPNQTDLKQTPSLPHTDPSCRPQTCSIP